ncbi:MAG: preprotein translocase subunit YajC [Treponemataceae bacterium]
MINLLLQLSRQQSAGQNGNILMTIVPFVLIFVIFYFFLIRPQNKKQKETDRMLNALKKGDKVITVGGIHGTVTSVKENTVVIRVDDNCKIEVNRTAISNVIGDKPVEEPKKEEKKGLFSIFKKEEKRDTASAKEKSVETKESDSNAEPKSAEPETKEENK